MGTAWDVSGAAHLPARAVVDLPDGTALAGRAATLLRLEGVAPSIAYRMEKLRARFGELGESAVLDGDYSAALWRAVRDAEPVAAARGLVWRVSVAPSAGPWLVAALSDHHFFRHFYDWSGGLIWIGMESDAADAFAADLR